jgi:indole-3-glycerol phosphate synthase
MLSLINVTYAHIAIIKRNIIVIIKSLYHHLTTTNNRESIRKLEIQQCEKTKDMITRSLIPLTLATALLNISHSNAFAPSHSQPKSFYSQCLETHNSKSSLNAIGVLARKAKEASVRKYCEESIDQSVLDKVKEMKANLASIDDNTEEIVGPVQSGLTKRKGTISVIAEYKRIFVVDDGFIDEMFDPDQMSPLFRKFGAKGVAVMADERMGGSSYDDLRIIVEEQAKATFEMPPSIPVINSDLIVDEVQIARTAAIGAQAVVITYGVVGAEKTAFFIKCAKALGLETIVAISKKEEAQAAIDAGARMISVVGIDDVEEKVAAVSDLIIPDNASILKIANILANDNKALEEVEEAWVCRDKGFNCVWVSDALYKSGNDPNEHAGAIIRSMGAKSSVKWASAKARSGKGEGAREYLGDLLM